MMLPELVDFRTQCGDGGQSHHLNAFHACIEEEFQLSTCHKPPRRGQVLPTLLFIAFEHPVCVDYRAGFE